MKFSAPIKPNFGRTAVAVAFGRVLRKARREKGFSQEELAAVAELDRTYPSLLELGKRTPTLTVLIQLAEALDTTAEDLVRKTQIEFLNSAGLRPFSNAAN